MLDTGIRHPNGWWIVPPAERPYWDRYNVALTSSLVMLRDAAEIALVLAQIDQERNENA